MERAEAIRRLSASKVGSIATVRPDGSPHVVPFVFAVSESGDGLVIYWCVDDKPKRNRELQRLVNIRAHPAVEIEVNSYDDDWTQLWWVRASGIGARGDVARRMGTCARRLGDEVRAVHRHPPSGPVVAIQGSTD